MNNYMKTIISGLKQWVSSQKSDWKQNDSSAPNYVKNRTHYEESKEITIFPKATFITEDGGGIYGWYTTTPISYPLQTKQTYIIVLDGNNYITSTLTPHSDEEFYLGNTVLIGGDDTKEPFGIMISASQLAIIIITDTEPTEHTLEIKGQETVIHKLDKKYLPDDLIPEEVLVPGDNISNLYNDSVVSYTEDQSLKLTDDQKARARNNIGAGTSNFSGSYNDLRNKPNALLYDQPQYISNSHLTNVYQNLKLDNNFLRIEANTPTQILSEKQQENTRAKIGVKDSPAYTTIKSEGIIINRSDMKCVGYTEDNITKILQFKETYVIALSMLPTENNKYLISINGLSRLADPNRLESRVFQGICKKIDDTTFYIGNLALRHMNENNSGEEFLCIVQPNQCSFYLETKKAESWLTTSIYLSIFDYSKTGYHTLDKRYLPTDILTSELVNDSLVTYSENQELTEEQKAQARENIGVKDDSNFYQDYSLPILYLNGDITNMTKDTAIDLTYIYGDKTGTANVKWQGSSSLAYPKKNYTVKFDTAFEAKEGWGEQKKYCLKANWVDFTHGRNIVAARLWADCVKRYEQYNTRALSFANAPNYGAIDGFPISLVINDEYVGLYSFNIPKDGWMFGLDKTNVNHVVIGASGVDDNMCGFLTMPVIDDNLGFEYEHISDSATDADKARFQTSIQNLYTALQECDSKAKLLNNVGQYLDITKAAVYMAYLAKTGNYDGITKNYLLVTTDGNKWHMSAYDLDSTFGNKPDGKGYYYPGQFTYSRLAGLNMIFRKIYDYAPDLLNDWHNRLYVLNPNYVFNKFYNYSVAIPQTFFNKELELWPQIPGTYTNNIAQALSFAQYEKEELDKELETYLDSLITVTTEDNENGGTTININSFGTATFTNNSYGGKTANLN